MTSLTSTISTFDITKEALPDLLLKIKEGKVQIPDLQRSFCWSDDLVIELLASVSLGWPFGCVMLLELGNPDWQFYPRLIEGVALKKQPEPSLLILDGQQRLTTLFMALFSNHPVCTRVRGTQRITKRWYYIDIEKALDPQLEREVAIISVPESRKKSGFGIKGVLDISTLEQEYSAGMFPIYMIFDYSQWRNEYLKYWQYDSKHLNLIDRFEKSVVKRFEHYQVPVIQLKSELPKPAVCRVFEKTNTQSTELNFFDLATACFASKDFSLREDWVSQEKRLKKFKVLEGVKNTDFLSCVTLVATYHRRLEAPRQTTQQLSKLPAVACGRNEVLSLTLNEYKAYADKVALGYEEAARFFHGQKIFADEDLPYQIQLVALAAILTVIGSVYEHIRSKLEQWFWSGCLAALYTGWHESRAARDMLEVPAWLLNGGPTPSTLTEAVFNENRLLTVRRRHGAIYRAVNALLRRNGAIDFATGEALSDVKFFNDPIESHHIFPVKYCRQIGIEMSQYNCLINRTPLSSLTNNKIGGKSPSAYLQDFEDKGIPRSRIDEILRSHLIEPELLRANDFEGFFEARTQALLNLISTAMGK
jgi:hypothetical protein